MNVAGVMSGSSLDGLDIAVVRFLNQGYELLECTTIPLSQSWKSRLEGFDGLSTLEFLKLEKDFSSYLGETILTYLQTISTKVDLLGVHGHTIVHTPEDGLTHQLGHGGIISAITKVDTVTDFRMQDVSKNGVGTPLVSILEHTLLSGYDYYLNLGGIANITKTIDNSILAYDICPCNQVLNFIAKNYAGVPYDNNGEMARNGSVVHGVLEDIDFEDYQNATAPKSLDNGWIKDHFINRMKEVKSPEDYLSTITHWIAEQISNQIESTDQEREILITGGGAYNSYLIELISDNIKQKNCKVIIPEPALIDFKEAILMAYMAILRVQGKHNVLSTVTHADSDTIAGAYYKY